MSAWFRAALSAALCAWLSTIYAVRSDAFYAMTIWPAFVWGIPGLAVLMLRRRGGWGLPFWLPLAGWALFIGVFSEEPRSIVRGWFPEPPRPANGFRVVTLNCASSIEAAREIGRWKPDLVLLEESPSESDLQALAKQWFRGRRGSREWPGLLDSGEGIAGGVGSFDAFA